MWAFQSSQTNLVFQRNTASYSLVYWTRKISLLRVHYCQTTRCAVKAGVRHCGNCATGRPSFASENHVALLHGSHYSEYSNTRVGGTSLKQRILHFSNRSAIAQEWVKGAFKFACRLVSEVTRERHSSQWRNARRATSSLWLYGSSVSMLSMFLASIWKRQWQLQTGDIL